VWKGQSETGWTVAVKEILADRLEARDLDFFQREVQILVRCNDEFLLDFIGFSTNPPAIVTSFMPCGSLWDRIHTKGKAPLNATQKTNIAIGIAHGMKYLHSHKIVHRDLKSPNILLDERMLPKIADFGLGHFVAECTGGEQTAVGTPVWMAPELIDSKQYGPAVDVYAYGIILYEMYTEKMPFEGWDRVQIFAQVATKGVRPELPETASSLAQLIVQCWDADPDKRPTFEEIYARFGTHAVSFPECEPRGADVLIHEIQQQEEITKNAVAAAAASLNQIIALRRQQLSNGDVLAGLIRAAQAGEVQQITNLIGAYLDQAQLNGKDASGLSPLHAAVQCGQVLVVQYLISLRPVDKNIVDADGNTPLIVAVKGQQKQIVQLLLNCSDVHVNLQNKNGQTALHFVSKGDKISQQAMIAMFARCRNVSLEVQDKEKKRPLQDAPELAQLLVQKQQEAAALAQTQAQPAKRRS
jgi:serine/threonine protein kinase